MSEIQRKDKSSKTESQLYAEAFGEDSIFGRKIPAAGTKGERNELSSESGANTVATEGLLSSIFGSRRKGGKI